MKVFFLKIHIRQAVAPMPVGMPGDDIFIKNKARNVDKMIVKVEEYHIYDIKGVLK